MEEKKIDEKKMKTALSVYKTMCDELDGKKLRYEKHEEDLVVVFDMRGDDLPIRIVLNVDAKRQLVRLISPLPFTVSEDKRMEAAIATSQVNYYLADGSFDFNYQEGKITFRLTSSFLDSLISKAVFEYIVGVTCYTVDEYNDKFLMLAKGSLPLEAFFKKP